MLASTIHTFLMSSPSPKSSTLSKLNVNGAKKAAYTFFCASLNKFCKLKDLKAINYSCCVHRDE